MCTVCVCTCLQFVSRRPSCNTLSEMNPSVFVSVLAFLAHRSHSVPFIVQSLSSRYAIVLGGYGPGYVELDQVEIVKHDKVCPTAISNVPVDPGRFLGDKSGMAEFVDGDAVIYCRHSTCWRLDMGPNTWTKISGFQAERDRAASAAVGGTMVVMGGRDVDGRDIIGFEIYNMTTKEWESKPEWNLNTGRYSFCAVPMNWTAVMVIGGYTRNGATDSVEILDIASGRVETGPPLPHVRYGHSCLMMEWAGREGILVSGGALTGKQVVFYDIKSKKWEKFPSLPYRTDGHKMVLIEGIPTIFSWRQTLQFDGSEWVDANHLQLAQSRSAFTVTTVPGHLVPSCQ